MCARHVDQHEAERRAAPSRRMTRSASGSERARTRGRTERAKARGVVWFRSERRATNWRCTVPPCSARASRFFDVHRADAMRLVSHGRWRRQGQSRRLPLQWRAMVTRFPTRFSTALIWWNARHPYSEGMRFSVESLHLSSAQDDPHDIAPAVPDVDRLCGRENGTTRSTSLGRAGAGSRHERNTRPRNFL